jgi:hypothetical protein
MTGALHVSSPQLGESAFFAGIASSLPSQTQPTANSSTRDRHPLAPTSLLKFEQPWFIRRRLPTSFYD